MVSTKYHVELDTGEPAWVVRAGVAQLPNGTRRLMPANSTTPIKPAVFDDAVADYQQIEHWATVRLGSVPPKAPAHVWREATGKACVLAAAERFGWHRAVPLLHAFGIRDLKAQGQLVEWALQLRNDQMPFVRRVAQTHGIGPVLAALELAGHDQMYLSLAEEHGVETVAGKAWR